MASSEQPHSPAAAPSDQNLSGGGFQQPATSFEPPSPTQQGPQTFAWGLANAGAAPPNSPFLFAASQATALDQPALAPPPVMASLDGMDPHVGSPSNAETSSVQPHPSLGSLSNASLAGGGGPASGGAGNPGLPQQFLQQGGAVPELNQQHAAAQLGGPLPNVQQLLQQQAVAAQQPLAQPQVQMVINPATGLPVAVPVPAAPRPLLHQTGALGSGNQQQRMSPPGASDPMQLMQQQLAASSQPLTSEQLAVSVQQQLMAAQQQQQAQAVPQIPPQLEPQPQVTLPQQPQQQPRQLPANLQAQIAANEQLNASLHQQAAQHAQQHVLGSSPLSQMPPASAVLCGLGGVQPSVSFPMQPGLGGLQPSVSFPMQPQQVPGSAAQLAAVQAAVSQQQASQQLQAAQLVLQQHQQQAAAVQQQQLQQQQQQQQHQLTAAQVDRVNRIAQATLGHGSQPGTATNSIKTNSGPSPPGSVVGSGGRAVAGAGSSILGGGSGGSILGGASMIGGLPPAPGLPPVGGLPGCGGIPPAAGLPQPGAITGSIGFPGFAALSQPMPLMGGAANLGMGLGMAPQPPMSAGFMPGVAAAAPQTADLAALIAHFERSLVAAAGGVQTPALLAQAQTAARQHLASQQLALQFAAAQAPMAGALGGMDPTAAAMMAASSALAGGIIPPAAPSLAGSMGSELSGVVSAPAMTAPVVPGVRPRVGKVKVVISAGGYFVKKGDTLDYQGGETRLVSIPGAARFQDLVDSLDRVASGSITSASSIGLSQTQVLALKYQLPSNPNVYVDVVDDEDVSLMLDEWQETAATAVPGTTPGRLHIFVQWRDTVAPSSMARPSTETESLNTSRHHSAESHEPRSQHHSAGSIGGHSTSSATAASPRPQGFEALAERMEIIKPEDIQLVKFLGAGGYGEVYLGKWHGCDAAIKCLNPGLFFGGGDVQNHAAVADLVKEADILGSLRHPNVVFVYGVVVPPLEHSEGGENGDQQHAVQSAPQGAGMVRPPAIVTEYMSGGSLRSALSRRLEMVQGGLTRLYIALDAAKGMEYLHSKGIVHFDMKSANLLLGHRDRRVICKVADFGLSKQKQQTYVSGVSSSRGTLPWIAPEIIKSPEAVTEKVDVYSYGIVLWELWTGREPFEGLNYHALLHQMTSAGEAMRPPLPGSTDWDAAQVLAAAEPAPGYRELLERCWNERPSQRPSFEAIVKELQAMAVTVRGKMPRRRPSASTASGSQASAPASAGQEQPQQPPQPPPQAPAAEEGADAAPTQQQPPAAAAAAEAAPAALAPQTAAAAAASTAAPVALAAPEAAAEGAPAAAALPTAASENPSVYSAFASEASQSQPSG